MLTLNGHSDWVRSVHATADNKYIISGSDDRTVCLWSLGDGKLVRTLNGHSDAVWSVHATADNKYIVSGSADRTVRIFPSRLPSPTASADEEEVEFQGQRTRAERDAEGRKRAVDLDDEGVSDGGLAYKTPRTSSSSTAAGASSSSAGGGSVPGLDMIEGLAALVHGLPAHIQAAAVKWCEENDAPSVAMIIAAEFDDDFVAALSLKQGGASEVGVRKRLAALREA
jgi:hypothetical protein